MTDETFVSSIQEMRDALYRVSYCLLQNEQDRYDAVQECLLIAWEKRNTLRHPEYIKTWVTRILINECRSIGRRLGRVTPMETLPDTGGHTPPPDADVAMHDALMSLPEKLRLPVVLYYMTGYGIKEIAGMLRIPQGTVSTRLRTGRIRLRELLGEEDEEVFSRA